MTSTDDTRTTAIPRQTTGDDARQRHLDAIFSPPPGPASVALDVSVPAVRAIIRLFLDIKAAEAPWTAGHGSGDRRLDLQDVVEAWFARIGLGLEESATSLVLGLVRGRRDPGLRLAEAQSCYGQECYGENCCDQGPELPDAYRHPGSTASASGTLDGQGEERVDTEGVPVALTDRCGGEPAETSDPDVLTEVAADLLGDVFDLARQGGLEPGDLVERALGLLNDQTSDRPISKPR
jgi:hypothetical protein